jgi:hypothetical protein
MKKYVLILVIIGTFFIYPKQTNAVSIPCSMILHTMDNSYPNAKGAALIYKVKLTPSFPRTSISIHALHLPEPSSLGNYDSYEGFAYIPEVISWRFSLYPTSEEFAPTWAGRFDLNTAEMENVEVQVRPTNLKTKKLGPSFLTNNIKYCD